MTSLPMKKADSFKESVNNFCFQNGPIKVNNVGDANNFIKSDSPIKSTLVDANTSISESQGKQSTR